MGFKRVFIVGLDHNFSFNGNVNETQKVHSDSNHFIKDYFPKGSTWETPDLLSSEYFYKELRMSKSLRSVKKAMRTKRIAISASSS